jgi:putative lipoic acid-binding regulatory protein
MKINPMPDDTPKPLIDYPNHYPFKVIGLRDTGFEEFVIQLFALAWGKPVPPEAIVENQSKGAKYVALTITLELHSEDQRLSMYALIHKEKSRILYYL